MILAVTQFAQRVDGSINLRTLASIKQMSVACQRLLGRLDDPISLHLLFAQGTRQHVVLGTFDARLQHAGNLVIRQPIGRLDQHTGLNPG
ncbi:hypothetical protein SDC9_189892 [bioreactor metagenome]|uniref:Uncharacterized protein n=1 Tax=bioreactor metagenome TaxID=1076179 RepID=A0A645HTE7_9ZZZZ